MTTDPLQAAPLTANIGDRVRKTKGYKFEGRVCGIFSYFTPGENGVAVKYPKFVNVQHDDGWVMHFRENELELIDHLKSSAERTGPEGPRDVRQVDVAAWCSAAFGSDHASSIPQRGIRHVEEAIEAAQAAGCERAMVLKLVDYVFDRPAGDLRQEIGGSGLTLLALAQAAGLSADEAECDEIARVKAKPLSHFAKRNRAKNEAGFSVGGPPPASVVSAPAPGEVEELVAIINAAPWCVSRIVASHADEIARAILTAGYRKSLPTAETDAGLKEENVILREGLEKIRRAIRGNDKYPDTMTARFYQGYNGGLNTAQTIAGETLARAAAIHPTPKAPKE